MYKLYCMAMCVIWYTDGMTNDMCLIAAVAFGVIDVLHDIVNWIREMHDDKIRERLK